MQDRRPIHSAQMSYTTSVDFLDPKRKKAHRTRLFIGYILMAIAVAMGTLILLFSAYGYDIDRKTGNIIQNGTVFIDTQPNGSTVTLNGVIQRDKTSSRLVLPGSSQYNLMLSQDGYRNWTRTFSLEGGQLERLTYPLLIPAKLNTKDVVLFAKMPEVISQSPDKRWLLLQRLGKPLTFDLFDLKDSSPDPQTLTVADSLLTDPTVTSSVSFVQWSSDNSHVLLDRAYSSKHEFIIMDIKNAASSVNVNRILKINPDKVALRNKKADLVYAVGKNGTLRRGDIKKRAVSASLLTKVIDFRTLGGDIILYATKTSTSSRQVKFRIRDSDNKSYLLQSIKAGSRYLMDISEYNSTLYVVIGTDASEAAFVYRDPFQLLKRASASSLTVSGVIRMSDPSSASFSPDGQFVALQGKDRASVVDLENDRQYKIDLSLDKGTDRGLTWVDNHHFVFSNRSVGYIVDFDGSNRQALMPSTRGSGPYFNPGNEAIFALSRSVSVKNRFALTQTSLTRE